MINFDNELIEILNDSFEQAKNDGTNMVNTIHVLLSILKSNNKIRKLLNDYKIYYENIKIEKKEYNNDYPLFTMSLKKALELSIINANEYRNNTLSVEMFFLSLLEVNDSKVINLFNRLKVDIDKLYNDTKKLVKGKNDKLDSIGKCLTEKKYIDSFDKVFQRDEEINRVINILKRKKKNNPLLIGEAGVGKSAIVEELSRRIYYNDVPDFLKGKKIIMISVSSLISGTKYRGEFEEKLDNIIKSIEDMDDVILFIDEIHTIIGAGGAEGAIDASNILKPYLARNSIKLIGATTTEEFNKYICSDKAFQRRFEVVEVSEPDYEKTKDILLNIKKDYEKYHNVIINKGNIDKIVKYSKKYIPYSHEPDKSIDLLDEICAYVSINKNNYNSSKLNIDLKKVTNLKNQYLFNKDYKNAIKCSKEEKKLLKRNNKKNYITDEDIKNVIENITNSKVITSKEKKELTNFVNNYISIDKKMLETIIDSFIDYSKELRNTPYSILIDNQNGIGKYISKYTNTNYINIDLNEYYLDTMINKFIGSPSGYVGYDDNNTIFESLKLHKNSIIEFNNIDNCNDKILNIIKSILTKGYLENNKGDKIDFSSTFIIFNTSNDERIKVGFNSNKINKETCIDKLVNKVISSKVYID